MFRERDLLPQWRHIGSNVRRHWSNKHKTKFSCCCRKRRRRARRSRSSSSSRPSRTRHLVTSAMTTCLRSSSRRAGPAPAEAPSVPRSTPRRTPPPTSKRYVTRRAPLSWSCAGVHTEQVTCSSLSFPLVHTGHAPLWAELKATRPSELGCPLVHTDQVTPLWAAVTRVQLKPQHAQWG